MIDQKEDEGGYAPLSALQHLIFCERQCALIHLEGLWLENRWTSEGAVMHQRVHDVTVERRPGIVIRRGMPVASDVLSMRGQCDVVELTPLNPGRSRRGPWKSVLPVEYKRGRAKNHEADKVQLCAQALCLEEMLAIPVTEGALYYGLTKRRLPVVFDSELRKTTLSAIQRLHALLAERVTPSVDYVAKRCRACSLLAVCLPRRAGQPTSASRWFQENLHRMMEREP